MLLIPPGTRKPDTRKSATIPAAQAFRPLDRGAASWSNKYGAVTKTSMAGTSNDKPGHDDCAWHWQD
jgi:hypothetical protein